MNDVQNVKIYDNGACFMIQAVKEFAEKVKKCSYCDNVFMNGKWRRYVFVDDIDKLLREYEK